MDNIEKKTVLDHQLGPDPTIFEEAQPFGIQLKEATEKKEHRDSIVVQDKIEQLMTKIDAKIEDNRVQDQPSVKFRKILFAFSNKVDKMYMFVGFVAAASCGLGLPSIVFLFGDIADSFGPNQPPDETLEQIKRTATVLTIIGGAILIAGYVFFAFLIIASERVNQKTRARYLQAILKQDISWFDQINTSELSSRLGKECQTMQRATGEKIGVTIMAFAMSTSGLAFAFTQGATYSAALLSYFPILFLMTYFITVAMQNGFNDSLRAYGQSAGYAEQALNSIKVVCAFGQEQTEIRNYDKYLSRARSIGVKGHLINSLVFGGFFMSIYGYYAYAFTVGSYYVTAELKNRHNGEDGLYSGGDIMSCFLGVVYGVFSLGLAAPNLKSIGEARIAGKLAFDIINRQPEIDLDEPNKQKIDNLKGRIEFRNVTFSYPTRPEQKVLDNFSCVIEQGKTTAIVGASGSGKSTVIQMIERFYDPSKGEVIIDGLNLKDLDLRDLRRKIGYVGQEPVLFNMTIKENLLFGKPEATDEEITKALESANALSFVNQMASKAETQVGNLGGQLSGGQKQRLAIARAFIKKPQMLLFDEATSALDKRNEKEVQGAIDKIRLELGGSITTVVVAHRLSTIKQADKIIVMKTGKIVEEGTHESLLREYADGVYAKFVREQEEAEAEGMNDKNKVSPDVSREERKNMDEEEFNHQIEMVQDLIKYPQSNVKSDQLNKQLEALEEQMKTRADEKDAAIQKKVDDALAVSHSRSLFKRLYTYNKPKINAFVGVIVSMLQGALMPVIGAFMAKMLFVLLNTSDLEEMRDDSDKWCGIMFLLAFGSFLTGFCQKFTFGVIGENVTEVIRAQLYNRIMSKHIGWFDKRENSPSILTSNLASDAQLLNGASSEGLSAIFEAIFAVITGILIGLYFNWMMVLVCFGLVPFVGVSGVMNARFNQGLSVEQANSHKYANLLGGDAIMNYKTVASFANEDVLVRHYVQLLEQPKRVAIRQAHIVGFSYGISQFILYGSCATLFYAGAQFNKKFAEDVDYTLYVFIVIFAMMFGSLEAGQAQQFGPDIGKAKIAAQRIFGIIDEPTPQECLAEKKEEKLFDCSKYQGVIEFKNVWFRYPTRKQDWILKGLNLTIKPNETIALVGESGCGKSTLASLLMRLYDPDYGHITIDGVDIQEYQLQSLRAGMGLVMQEPTLFNYSILENILYGSLEASNSEVRESADIANALEFIENDSLSNVFDDQAESLLQYMDHFEHELISALGTAEFEAKKKKLLTIVKKERKRGMFLSVEGDIDKRPPEKLDIKLEDGFKINCGLRGGKLSGGQKQRIAIARAIIRRPKILILDEATSALDEESQKKVQVALDNIMHDRTSIVIAHRLSTIEKCDRIIVLDNGILVEEGNFSDLKKKENGFFAQLASGMQQSPEKVIE